MTTLREALTELIGADPGALVTQDASIFWAATRVLDDLERDQPEILDREAVVSGTPEAGWRVFIASPSGRVETQPLYRRAPAPPSGGTTPTPSSR